MPPLIKPWLKYPPNTSTPINDVSLKAMEARLSNYVGAQNIGPGVNGTLDFAVAQTGVASMVLNIGPANVQESAFISWDANGSTTRYDYNGAQLTVNVITADPTNPRIDRVILTPVIDSTTPTPSVLPGTPTGGATLDNLTGAQVVPVGSLLLADVLVAAGATSIVTAAIQDRRQLSVPGVPSNAMTTLAGLDMVTPIPHPLLGVWSPSGVGTVAPGNTNGEYGYLALLPRRIKAVTRLRWRYQQGPTALTGTYNIGIFEASGRQIVATGGVALAGALNTYQQRSEVITSQDFEAGAYFIVIGYTGLAGGNIYAPGPTIGVGSGGASPGMNVPGIAMLATSPSVPLPTRLTSAMDLFSTVVTGTTAVVPLVTLATG